MGAQVGHAPLLLLLLALCAAVHGHEYNPDAQQGAQLTSKWAVKISPHSNIEPHELAAMHGFTVLGKVANFHDVLLFEQSEPEKLGHINLPTSEHVSWAEQQIARRRYKRDPADPLYRNQWHLHDHSYSIGANLVWQQNVTGKQIQIAVVDDGIERTHPDVRDNYNAEGSYDINYNDGDPTPDSGDSHGTSAAGVAAAGANNYCGVGVAPNARLAGLRLLARNASDHEEALALNYRSDINHIYTNSWGPPDNGRTVEGPGTLLMRAMEDAIQHGRDGKGSIYVWAAGNGRSVGDNCNFDGYANSRYTIAVGAIDDSGRVSWYSEPCSALICVTPSSGRNSYIATTSLHNGCTSQFGGTSASSPMLAGVIALMLEVNPSMTWRDVQGALVSCSVKVDANHPDWITNGAGLSFNHNYGFGRVIASPCVAAARSWMNYPALQQFDTMLMAPTATITSQGLRTNYQISQNFIVEHVELVVYITARNRGDIQISLISPSGTTSNLAPRHTDTGRNFANWKFMTVANWGESSAGTWYLQVTSQNTIGSILNTWQLIVYGH